MDANETMDEILDVRIGEFALDPNKEYPALINPSKLPEHFLFTNNLPPYFMWILSKK